MSESAANNIPGSVADPIDGMVRLRGRGGIVRWAGERPADPYVCVECGADVSTTASRCRGCGHEGAALDRLMAVLERNLAELRPGGLPSCSCGCLLKHDLELCPACGVEWAERDEVRWSWRGEWWAA